MNKKLKTSDLELNVINENTKTDIEKVQAVKKAYTKVSKKKVKVIEPKNYYLFFKNSINQPDFGMIRFNQKEQAVETAKTWEKKKLCILISVEELNEFILSKK